jgi:mxaJ protein
MSFACPERTARCPLRTLLAACLLCAAGAGASAGAGAGAGEDAAGAVDAAAPLRVCADPDNMPLSHASGAGLEDRLAALLAQRLGRPLVHAWLPDRRGFVRKTLLAGVCDVVMGVPQGMAQVATTQAYYRTTFVFAGRATEAPPRGFDDPRLARMRLGVQLIGTDPGASPVGYALARVGATEHVRGFTAFDGPGSAAERMMQALDRGALDGVLLWGAQAGYYVRRSAGRLSQSPLAPPAAMAGLPFDFGVAMAVRPGDQALLRQLEDFIVAERSVIDRLVADYGVLRTDLPAQERP